MIWPEIHEPFRQMARERWDYVSPYRLGILIGEHGGGLAATAEYGPTAAGIYERGVQRGLVNRAKKSRMK